MRRLLYLLTFFLVAGDPPPGPGGGMPHGGGGMPHGGAIPHGAAPHAGTARGVEERAVEQQRALQLEKPRAPLERPLEKLETPRAPLERPIEKPQAVQPNLNAIPTFIRQEVKNIPAQPAKGVPEKVRNYIEKVKALGKPVQKATPAAQTRAAPKPSAVQTRLATQFPQMQQWFTPTFFYSHNYFPPYFRRNFNGWGWGWGWPTWVVINNYLDWGWDYPYDYPPSGPPVIVTQPVTNVTNQYFQPAPQAAPAPEVEQPTTPAEEAPAPSAPKWTPEQELEQKQAGGENAGNWMPLGVFAAGRTLQDVNYSSQFIQLALGKEGQLAGTYYNAATNQVHPLGGTIDKETQLAAWTVTDDPNSPVMTTGIYNLTQDKLDVKVHFPNGVEQSWVLVRLQNGQQGNGSGSIDPS